MTGAMLLERVTPACDLEPRSVARVAGRIVAVQVEPADAAPTVVARIDDGTGFVHAVFMGRREVPGIEPGRTVDVEGRVCETTAEPRIYNPRYELR
ncbi:OB-fold nucleic acid binding domain-containing protein [Demequina capsici]|uniref:OB-fold nucleic acid binding domain-containing protein n=1 Tax=Demequina capsici TaxID=3075620 RepID=A0AA96JH28_9MICO|nr:MULTISPECIES: OB-fold nucleic acid binding domain-containing protein [unclassified Demequina]WNM25709.1 OB-fold nucleic acid binding domain-containing protein [Demequina sp. OYTSA14]WNM28604.1 OB-fold nucleic acid binding domain-containing protein [Demequina sp. PMTSA13]